MNVAAVQMENIGHFLDASLALGLKKTDLFRTPDLWDGITVGQRPLEVTLCILRLRDLCREPGSGVVEEEEEEEEEESEDEEDEEEEEGIEEGVPPEAEAAPAPAAVAEPAPAPAPRGGRARARTLELTAANPLPETEANGEVNTPITQADLGTCGCCCCCCCSGA